MNQELPKCTFCDLDVEPGADFLRVRLKHAFLPIIMCEPCWEKRHNGDKLIAHEWVLTAFGCDIEQDDTDEETSTPQD